MSRSQKGGVIIKISGILGVFISVFALILAVVSAKWNFYVLLNIPQIFLHIYLFVMGYWSRVYDDMRLRTLLIGGSVGVILSGYIFVSMIGTFLLTLRMGLYLLAFPVTALFLIGVIIRGTPRRSE